MQGEQGIEQEMRDNDNIDDSIDWREEQNQHAKFKNARIKDLFPINYSSEMQRFFQNQAEYNPHFCYKVVVSPQVIPLSTEFEHLANKILLNNTFEKQNLPLLTQDEVVKHIQDYLEQLGLGQYVQIQFESNCLSRTSILFFKEKAVLKIRLNHKDNCVRKPSQKGKLIEEGLAVINQLIVEEHPFFFKAALRYNAAIYASKMNFSQVYKQLSKYLKNQKDCWRETVRVKRGLGNTEEHGGYYKDQSYLIGAIEILRDRQDIDFRKIFYGKLSPSETLNLKSGVLPPFIDSQQKYKYYLKKLDAMAICNFID